MLALIPLDPDSLLISRKSKLHTLELMLSLMNEAIGACCAFQNKNYIAFDAQVGETSCQIRAYKVCLLAHNPQFIIAMQIFTPQLIKYKNSIAIYTDAFKNNMRINSRYLKELDQKERLESFFSKIENSVAPTDDHLFIILSHFLNKFCLADSSNMPYAINYNLIKKLLDIKLTAANNLAQHYQSILSSLSCNFVFEQSAGIHVAGEANEQFFREVLRIGDAKRYTLPYYYVTKVLLAGYNTATLPIIFTIRNRGQNENIPLILFFKKDANTDKIVLQSVLNKIDKHAPAIVFQGSVLESEAAVLNDFKNKLLQIGVREVILFNAANHPQYAGAALKGYATDPYKDIIAINQELEKIVALNVEELRHTRISSQAFAYSKDNSRLFYVEHIFCSSFYAEYQRLFYGE